MAREGVYPHATRGDVSDASLDRHFGPDEGHYRVASDLRDHLVFAAHNLLRDPPFSRLHLVSCRNLLIYLDRELQDQVMRIFRYACRDDAYLLLGASESTDEELFEAIDKKHHLFVARPRDDAARALPDILAAPAARTGHRYEIRQPARTTAAEIHLAALEEAAPPSVVVDERGEVLH